MKNEKISKEIVKSRYEIFNAAKERIKKEFFGIDDVIDKVFTAMETWYIYPEFMTRPCIINLWGLTGVGKTDLVKKIKTYLKIDKYAFTEMDNTSTSVEDYTAGVYVSSERSKSVFDLLNQFDITPNSHAILLFDEIHRYRTIDKSGNQINHRRYGDIWKLLSDGILYDSNVGISILTDNIAELERQYDNIKIGSSNSADSFEEKMNLMMGINKIDENKIKEEKKNKDEMIKKLGYLPYEYRKENMAASEYDSFLHGPSKNIQLHNLINIIDIDKEDMDKLKMLKFIYQGQEDYILNEIYLSTTETTDDKDVIKRYFRSCSNMVILEWLRYKKKKMLETFSKLDAVEMRDENSKYVFSNLLIFICGNTEKEMYKDRKLETDIREYLKTLFRPEQISRFGSNYIEYPVLSEEVYDKVIFNEIEYTEEKLKREYGTDDIKFDRNDIYQKVMDEIPNDYVFDGIRPIYSAVQRVLSNIIPKMLINIFEK